MTQNNLRNNAKNKVFEGVYKSIRPNLGFLSVYLCIQELQYIIYIINRDCIQYNTIQSNFPNKGFFSQFSQLKLNVCKYLQK